MALTDSGPQTAHVVLSILTLPLAIAASILRFYATRRASRKVGAEDWCALAATVFFVGYASIDIYAHAILLGRDLTSISLSQLTTVLKLYYVVAQLFPLNQVFAKLSILLLYHRIFSVNRTYAKWIIFLGVLQTVWAVAAVLTQLLQCTPVHSYWDVLTLGTCFGEVPMLVGFEVPNSLLDFAMVALVLIMLRDLQIRTSTKWKLAFLFAVGGFVGLIGFLKIATHFTAGQDTVEVIGLWGLGQMFCSVVCCCVPIFNSIMPKVNIISRLRTLTSSFSSKSRAQLSNIRTNSTTGKRTMQSGSDTDGNYSSHYAPSGWMQLGGGNSDTKGFATANYVRAQTPPDSESSYPLGTVVVVHQGVEMV
ncbi:hypothetical protein QBC46DRAFT_426015 [Diplogelasinospora grovesii]|uniref:Rhodopsin domain-containing protein n=1 Tax=Diplogelasinospora grovesii TaxID=303347 RepID=A0AAN6MWN2_9PEZI|nr:hypothetical protein QBC46DRAFT_426015 [Diplogelasinospora grovesii]